MCTLRLIHKDKTAKCRFFTVPDGPALPGMSDIELLGLLKIMCELVGCQQVELKYDSQTIKLSRAPSCKANTDQEISKKLWLS